MKRIFKRNTELSWARSLLVFLILIWPLAKSSGAKLELENFNITAGETKDVELLITGGSIKIVGLQADIETPEDLSIIDIKFSEKFRYKDFYLLEINPEYIKDGKIFTRFIIYPKVTSNIPGDTTGPLLTVTFKADEEAHPGENTIIIDDIMTSTEGGSNPGTGGGGNPGGEDNPGGGNLNPSLEGSQTESTGTIVVEVKEIQLNRTTATLTIGTQFKLIATVLPINSGNKEVSWESSNPRIATVDSDGNVMAIALGTTEIKCISVENPSIVASCNIIVSETQAEGITVAAKGETTLKVGETVQLEATVYPESTHDKSVTWLSLSPKIASVTETGLVTALSEGNSVITATNSAGHSAEITITVVPTPAISIELDKNEISLYPGDTEKISATVLPSTTTNKTIIWESENEQIAQVTTAGVVTAVSVGSTYITAACGDVKAICKVTVSPVASQVILLYPQNLIIRVGENELISATVLPETTTDKSISWSSDDPDIANVAQDGKVTAISQGTAIITAVNGEVSANCKVTVLPPLPTAIEIIPQKLLLKEGETGQLNVSFTPADAISNLTWESRNSNIATVDNLGLVTAKAEGETIVKVTTTEGLEATCEIEVKSNLVAVTNISIMPKSASVRAGKTVTLKAIITPENSTDKNIEWSSADTSVATVENGVVTGLKPGKVIITATASNGIFDTSEITVEPPVPTAITLSPETLELIQDETFQLNVRLTPADASTTLTWQSNNTTVATVDEHGMVSAVSPGNAVISVVTEEGLLASCGVKVKSEFIQVSDIEVHPETATVRALQTVILTAKIYPENATDKNVDWISSDESIATVENGVVTGLKKGEVTITALASNGKSATSIVTVLSPLPTSVSIVPSTLKLLDGEKEQLTAILTPADAETTITWSSLDKSVVTVDANGMVSSVSVGSTQVKVATKEGIFAYCDVIVYTDKIEVESISLAPEESEIKVGKTITLNVIFTPEDATDKSVVWASSDQSIATVSDGIVTGLYPGEVTIMAASNNGKMATAKVTVKPAGEIIEVENIRLSAQDLTLMAGTTSLLKATVEPEDATNINLAWSVADATIASVSSDGTVTAIKEGRTTVTVTCGDVSATCQVTVKEDSEITVIPGEGTNPGDDDDSPADNTENGGSLSGKDLTIRVGQTASVDLVLPEGLSEMPQFDWNLAPGGADYVSMTTSTSTLSASFTGLKEGQTSYNVLLKGNAKVLVTGKVTVIAEHPMTSLSLDPAQISMPLNSDPVQIKAVCTPENASNLTLTWSSSNPGVATVSDNGIVTPVAVGQTTITATTTDGSMLSASSEVTVFEEQHYAPIEVTLSEQNMIVRDGDEINMWAIATGGYENGWKFIWTSGENPTEILSEENHITIKAQNSNIEPLTVIYNLSILNKDDREILYEETFDYAIEIWSNPVLPGEPGYEGEEGSTGVNVSETSVREGNLLTLNADEPIGGYNFYWTYNWTFENAEIGEDEEITLVAGKESGWTGKEKSINECVYNVKLTNYGPNGELWTEALLSSPIVKVYNRPVTPAQLLRKGDGTSCTFIVIIDLLYDELTDLGYEFVYGYTDATGEDHILATTPLRYCHTTEKIYNDPSNTFWAYAIWSYEDGSAVSSGLRYLDGSEDPYFDASVFDGSYNSRSQETEGKDVTAIYTLDGHYVGNDTSRLVPGIYLINKMEGNKIVSKKFVKR